MDVDEVLSPSFFFFSLAGHLLSSKYERITASQIEGSSPKLHPRRSPSGDKLVHMAGGEPRHRKTVSPLGQSYPVLFVGLSHASWMCCNYITERWRLAIITAVYHTEVTTLMYATIRPFRPHHIENHYFHVKRTHLDSEQLPGITWHHLTALLLM